MYRSNANRYIVSDYIDKQFNKELAAIKKARKKLLKRKNKAAHVEDDKNLIEIYTDGSCSPNPGRGSYAFLVLFESKEIKRDSGVVVDSTNNKMEITAPVLALEWLRNSPHYKNDLKIIVYSDSQYVINGITKWIKGWIERKWKTVTDDPVKNQEEWQRLHTVNSAQVKWKWVRGHDLNYYNEICDEMAKQARIS